MPDAHRRVIRKPDGLGPDEASQLAARLRTAIADQQRLAARSAHVLCLQGDLQEDDHTFFVEHEPARALSVENLYDQTNPSGDEKHLLRYATALLHALRIAHELGQPRAVIHGGLCPATLLTTPDGIPKFTDFGFASAVGTVLGGEAYKNLALSTPPQLDDDAHPIITGTWEVLTADVRDRDDRLCAFIDPASYAAETYPPVEQSADLLAGGIVLYLLAHHRHPYYFDDPESHRDVEAVEFGIGFLVPTQNFRNDLRNHSDPTVRLWCDLVGRLVHHIPQERPKITDELVEKYLTDEPPDDAVTIARRGFETLLADLAACPLDTIAWETVRPKAAPLADDADDDSDLTTQARALLTLADACDALHGNSWRDAEPLLADLREHSDLHDGIALKVNEASERIAHNLAVDKALNQVDKTLAAVDARDPIEARAALEAELARIDALPPTDTLLTDVANRVEQCRDALSTRTDAVVDEIQRRRDDAHARIETLRQNADAERWENVAEQLQSAFEAAYLSADASATLADIETRFAGHRERVIREARERADALLTSAQQSADKPDGDSDDLLAAMRQAEQALKIAEITDEQRTAATRLRERCADRLKSWEDEATVEIKILAKAEEDLTQARKSHAAGRLVEAETDAQRLLDEIKFPQIKAAAEQLLNEVRAALATFRDRLRERIEQADEQFAAAAAADPFEVKAYEAVRAEARAIGEDEHADDAIRTGANRLIKTADDALADHDQRAADAQADFDSAVAALPRAALSEARERLERVSTNRHAAATLRDEVSPLLAELPRLEAAQALLERNEFPAASKTLGELLQQQTLPDPIQSAVSTLKRESGRRHAKMLRATLVGVLGGDDPPADAPTWVSDTIASMTLFVDDCDHATQPAPTPPELTPGQQFGDKYEIIKHLGTGGMGAVYHALDTSLDREVVLKIAPASETNPALDQALEQEAKAIVKLKHDHIMHINSSGVIDGRRYFETDYIHGQDLAAYSREHALTEPQIAELLRSIADALAEAHDQGVLHRDIKPQNIYIADKEGQGPWLIDFGLARMRNICDQRARTGLCGTPGYIAPEVITSMGDGVDHRADIFALGAVLYGLLAKSPPFQDASTAAASGRVTISRVLLNTLRSHTRPIDEAAPNAHADLRSICRRAMAPELSDRYASASALAADLAAFVEARVRDDARRQFKAARAIFEGDPRNEPAEYKKLKQVRKLVETLQKCSVDEVRTAADQFVEEINAKIKQIKQLHTQAKARLAEAANALAVPQFDEARDAAGDVLENPYAPEMHAEATQVLTQLAKLRLEQAGEALTAGRFKPARDAAGWVRDIPHVGDAHDEAQTIIEAARRAMNRQLRNRVLVGSGVTVLALLAAALLPKKDESVATIPTPILSPVASRPVVPNKVPDEAPVRTLVGCETQLNDALIQAVTEKLSTPVPSGLVDGLKVTWIGNPPRRGDATSRAGISHPWSPLESRLADTNFTITPGEQDTCIFDPTVASAADGLANAVVSTVQNAVRDNVNGALTQAGYLQHFNPDQIQFDASTVSIPSTQPGAKPLGLIAVQYANGTLTVDTEPVLVAWIQDRQKTAGDAVGKRFVDDGFTVGTLSDVPGDAPTLSIKSPSGRTEALELSWNKQTLAYALTAAARGTYQNMLGMEANLILQAEIRRYVTEDLARDLGTPLTPFVGAGKTLDPATAEPKLAAQPEPNDRAITVALQTALGPLNVTLDYQRTDDRVALSAPKTNFPALLVAGQRKAFADLQATAADTIRQIAGTAMDPVRLQAAWTPAEVNAPVTQVSLGISIPGIDAQPDDVAYRWARAAFEPASDAPPSADKTKAFRDAVLEQDQSRAVAAARGFVNNVATTAKKQADHLTFQPDTPAVDGDRWSIAVSVRDPAPTDADPIAVRVDWGRQAQQLGYYVVRDADATGKQIDALLPMPTITWPTATPAEIINLLATADGEPWLRWLTPYQAEANRRLTFDVKTGNVRLNFPWSDSRGFDATLGAPTDRTNATPAGLAAAIDQALKAEADKVNTADYLAAWADRRRLEDKLPAANGSLRPDEAGGLLAEMARIKWLETSAVTTQGLVPMTNNLASKLREGIGGWDIAPTRFVEYFIGPRFIHAIDWSAADPANTARYTKLIKTDQALFDRIDDAIEPGAGQGPARRELGRQLLGPICTDEFFTARDGSFGVVLAPDGPLLYVPFAQLPFREQAQPRSLDLRQDGFNNNPATTVTGNVEKLADLCAGNFYSAYTAIWTLPSTVSPSAALKETLWQVPWSLMLGRNEPPPVRARSRAEWQAVELGANVIGTGRIPAANLWRQLSQQQGINSNNPPPNDGGFWQGRLQENSIILNRPVPPTQ